jgi:hypothetical protein
MKKGPLLVGMAGALGVAAAALAGLFEPGWGFASAFALLCAALAAGVVRDPDGPEIHLFLGVAMALTAGFTVTHVAVVLSETDRARTHAIPELAELAREEIRRGWRAASSSARARSGTAHRAAAALESPRGRDSAAAAGSDHRRPSRPLLDLPLFGRGPGSPRPRPGTKRAVRCPKPRRLRALGSRGPSCGG